MKIKVIIPNANMDPRTLKEREEMLSRVSTANSVISVDCITTGPISIESSYDEILVGPELVDRCIEAEKNEFDAIIIYCLNDPAIKACREMVNIPVIGPGQVSMMISSTLGYKFSILTVLDEMIAQTAESVRYSGIDPTRLASVKSINTPVKEVRKNTPETIKKLIGVGKKCIEEDQAQVLLLGCLGFAGMAKEVEKVVGVPVVDPAFASISFCELLLAQQLSFSKKAFPTPIKKTYQNH